MTPQLYIAKGGATNPPTLPLDAVTRTFAILGQRGTGKTSTAVVMVEEMARKGGHVVVLDPVGAWYGITRAGERKGVPGIVIGGEHGDVPLEDGSGALLADIVIGQHWPVVVIDLKLMRKGAQLRLLADLLEGIFHSNREPLHVVFEEADRALPQQPRGMDPTLGRVLGAGEDIVKLGRSRGLGATLVSQRPATVNKNVLEVCETLLLHRLMGPNDRRAVKGWVEANGDERELKTVMDSMSSLKVGEAWLYSPGWLRVLDRIRVRARHTFDSSATPEVGQQVVAPSERAPVDLGELRRLMADTVKRAEENDPKALKARVAELTEAVANTRASLPKPERVLVPDREAVGELLKAVQGLDRFLDELHAATTRLREEADSMVARVTTEAALLDELKDRAMAEAAAAGGLPDEGQQSIAGVAVHAEPRMPRDAVAVVAPSTNGDGGELSAGARKLRDEMAKLAPLRLSRTQLATILQRGARSSTLTMQLAELTSAGAITNEAGRYRVVGGAAADGMSPAVLRERWRQALPDGPRALLDVLLERRECGRDELFAAAGFSPKSSTPVTHLKLLKDNGLAEGAAGWVALGPALAG